MSAPTQFGAMPLPVPVAGATETVADPGLDVLLAFARAVIVARCGNAYADIAPGTGSVVKLTRAHNPGEIVVTEKQFPGLWGWRTGGTFETIADDFDTEVSRITLLWVFAPAQAENQRVRGPIVNGIAKSLSASVMRGRDPAWVLAGDTEPQAVRNGSFLWSHAGWFALDGRPTWKVQDLIVDKGEPGRETRATYPAVQWELTVRELVHLGTPTDPNQITTTLGVPGTDTPTAFSLPIPPPLPDPDP